MKDYPIIVNKKIVLIDDSQHEHLNELSSDGICCLANQADGAHGGFGCTRAWGHAGPHVAHTTFATVAVWTEPITFEEWESLSNKRFDFFGLEDEPDEH
jgi:hypothetical protein